MKGRQVGQRGSQKEGTAQCVAGEVISTARNAPLAVEVVRYPIEASGDQGRVASSGKSPSWCGHWSAVRNIGGFPSRCRFIHHALGSARRDGSNRAASSMVFGRAAMLVRLDSSRRVASWARKAISAPSTPITMTSTASRLAR